jgi:hypothetical protein
VDKEEGHKKSSWSITGHNEEETDNVQGRKGGGKEK